MKSRTLYQDSASPLYKQLIKQIKSDILAGVYPVHSRIPSEQQLCEAYHVSRVTVRKALAELTQQGLLTRHQGKGSFVSIPRIQKDLKVVNSFHTACARLGCKASGRILHRRLQPASSEDIKKLSLAENQQVIEISRLRLADDIPVMLEVNRFPDTLDFLLTEDFQSLYRCLEAITWNPPRRSTISPSAMPTPIRRGTCRCLREKPFFAWRSLFTIKTVSPCTPPIRSSGATGSPLESNKKA